MDDSTFTNLRINSSQLDSALGETPHLHGIHKEKLKAQEECLPRPRHRVTVVTDNETYRGTKGRSIRTRMYFVLGCIRNVLGMLAMAGSLDIIGMSEATSFPVLFKNEAWPLFSMLHALNTT